MEPIVIVVCGASHRITFHDVTAASYRARVTWLHEVFRYPQRCASHQAEKTGLLQPGDLLVGVGTTDVRGKDLKTVRGLIKQQGRPLTLYFREPPDCRLSLIHI